MAPASERHGGHFKPPSPGASEQIALQIRRYLEEQHLEPGARLGTELELADEFGVSRPTLREALRLLSGSQLIRVDRGRSGGIFVARTPYEGMSRNLSDSIALMLAAENVSMAELLDARLSLEVSLAGRAARHADVAVADQLEEAVNAAVGHAPGTEPFNAADARFHEILAEAAGNKLLVVLTAWISEVLQPTLNSQISGNVDAEEILSQHRAILRAVRRNQGLAAERAMKVHIEYVTNALGAIQGGVKRARYSRR